MNAPIQASEDQQKAVRIAARSLARAGFVHAYGHCSLRLDKDHFLVCASKPMGLINPRDAGTVVPVEGALPDGVLGEVRIHQQIYKKRADIQGVCRTMPPNVMTLSALRIAPKPRHGFGSYFSPEIPLWDDVQLIRTDQQAQAVVATMGEGKAVMMRGNGLVTAGTDIERAVVWAWYAEDMCRVELEARRSGLADKQELVLSGDVCLQRATEKGRIVERMWDYLSSQDPEV